MMIGRVFRVALIAAACLMACSLLVLAGCHGSSASSGNNAPASFSTGDALDRADITSSDGEVLATSQQVGDGLFSRVYPFGSTCANVIGSRNVSGGLHGIEQRYEEELASGQDVRLTLDSKIQGIAARALDGVTGAAVVLDPETGAVLAMASTPSYDPDAQAIEGSAAVDHATELHAPGSTFKTVTLAAGLEEEAIAQNTRLDAPAEISFPDGPLSNYDDEQHVAISLEEAYAQSVNTAFAQIALQVGADGLAEAAAKFGFGVEAASDFELPASTFDDFESFTARELALAGIGQPIVREGGAMAGPMMTPVEGAAIASSVVNGGRLVRPYLVDTVGGRRTAAAEDPAATTTQAISADTASFTRRCMLDVVATGTGRAAAVDGVTIGGKTGTAETPWGYDDGWFIGFAEKDGQEYAFAVLVERSSSSEASQIASEVVRGLYG